MKDLKVKQKKKKKKPLRRKPDHLDHISKFLKSKGWKLAVIGGEKIQQPFGSLPHNYEYVVGFTGIKGDCSIREVLPERES